LRQYAYRASRKPSRSGAPNALFVVASIEAPPPELLGVADEVRVIFPWAALLRGLLLAEERILSGLAVVAKPGAAFDVVLTYDPTHDHGAGLGDAIAEPDLPSLEALSTPYAAAGLRIDACLELTRDEALAIPSTWGRRLLHGRDRRVFRLSGHVLHPKPP
jgi:16S rRNA (adenine(1408)-N(1))-methyltransferase